jgi:hypothetical protein
MVENIAFGAGIATGSILLLSVAWVWTRKQAFGMGGSVMCTSGIALVGLTVWRTIQFEITEDGVIARFQAQVDELNEMVADVDTSLDTIATTNAAMSRDMATLNASVVSTSEQFRALTGELAQRNAVPADRATELRNRVIVPQLDTGVFEERARVLERSRIQ